MLAPEHMKALLAIPGAILLVLTLWDAFETMILPRRVSRRLKFTRWFYKYTWAGYSFLARRSFGPHRREGVLGFYGPASFILLFAVWAALLILSFAMLYSSTSFHSSGEHEAARFTTDLYFSGTSFFTLGLGDVTPGTTFGRVLTVAEAGMGFGFLAVVIGYLPVLYQAFSRREVHISLLDARAGSPPTAMGLLTRYDLASRRAELDEVMGVWELWAAELLESHLSFPQLGYFRSQHDRQSWVAALCSILDANAVLIAITPDPTATRPQLAFAMARHAAIDLGQIFGRRELFDRRDRLPPEDVERLRGALAEVWPQGQAGDDAVRMLNHLRAGYEEDIGRIAERLLMPLPPWFPDDALLDDWETILETS